MGPLRRSARARSASVKAKNPARWKSSKSGKPWSASLAARASTVSRPLLPARVGFSVLTGFTPGELEDRTFPMTPLSGNVSQAYVRCGLARGPAAKLMPNIVFGKVGATSPPPKVPNAERRGREHPTPVEIDRPIAAAHRLGRHGRRDATMIRLAYRHGLRVSELAGLRRGQLDLRQAPSHVRRRENGRPSTHPPRGPELRARREVLREYPDSAYVLISERGAPMTAARFRKRLARAGDAAKLDMPVHPHMLRHSTGFKLANDGQDTRAIRHYPGHRNIRHTVLHTQIAADRCNDFWED
jgi:integrase